jgi:hypothetical protein
LLHRLIDRIQEPERGIRSVLLDQIPAVLPYDVVTRADE